MASTPCVESKFGKPYFDPKFTKAVARVRSDVFVATIGMDSTYWRVGPINNRVPDSRSLSAAN